MKNDPPQFKADAVALYQSRPEATIRQIAADLGINPKNPSQLGPGCRCEPASGASGGRTG
jgi:transposase